MNKKGMLSQFISGFIVIMIGITLVPMISNQIDMATHCNSTIQNVSNDPYYGKTDSFGGGGSEHFGGYDGNVSHKSFLAKADFITGNSNSSIVGCIWQDGSVSNEWAVALMNIVPGFFAICIIVTAIVIFYNSFKTFNEL